MPKAGLFKGLIALLLAAKKFVILAIAGIVAWFRRLFTRTRAVATAAPGAGAESNPGGTLPGGPPDSSADPRGGASPSLGRAGP